MADIDVSSTENDLNPRGARIRWFASVLLLLAMTGVTVVALHWYQPIRALLDTYFDVATPVEETLETEGSLIETPGMPEPSEFAQNEETIELDGTDQTPRGFETLRDPQEVDVPFTVSVRDFAAVHDPIEAARFELQIALLAIGGNGDLTLASDALRHVHSIAISHRLNPKFIDTVDQALAEMDYLSKLDLESIQHRVEAVSTRIMSLNPVDLEHQPLTDTKPESKFEVSEQPEARGFWGELADGISSVYEIRRIDETNSVDNDRHVETGAQIRVLLLVERARSEIRTLDFESYRESLNEAQAIIDSLSQADTEELSLIRDQLRELAMLEVTSPYETIRSALEFLSDRAATHGIEAGVVEP